MTRRTAACTSLAVLAAGLAAAGGCAEGSSVRRNLTPELNYLQERHVDSANRIALTLDENGRMFNEDLRRFLLLDRPSLLTPYPMPH